MSAGEALAAGGVRFRNAFVTLSLCAPSRSAFLTSRYGHVNGVVDNRTPFPADNVTSASLLRASLAENRSSILIPCRLVWCRHSASVLDDAEVC